MYTHCNIHHNRQFSSVAYGNRVKIEIQQTFVKWCTTSVYICISVWLLLVNISVCVGIFKFIVRSSNFIELIIIIDIYFQRSKEKLLFYCAHNCCNLIPILWMIIYNKIQKSQKMYECALEAGKTLQFIPLLKQIQIIIECDFT